MQQKQIPAIAKEGALTQIFSNAKFYLGSEEIGRENIKEG
jgi:hypothetical protein